MALPILVASILSLISIASLFFLSRYLLILEICIYFLFSTIFTQNYFRIAESVYEFFRISKGVRGLLVLQLEYSFIIPALLVWVVTFLVRKKFSHFLISGIVWIGITLWVESLNKWVGAIKQDKSYLTYTFVFDIISILIVVTFVFIYRKMIRREGFTI